MIQNFSLESSKFMVQENHEGITAEGVDVECIFSLKDKVDGGTALTTSFSRRETMLKATYDGAASRSPIFFFYL
jgi:hypothetical protein